MKQVLVVFFCLISFNFYAQEVKTQKDILQIPNTDLVKDFNLKIGNAKPVKVSKTTYNDMGFGYENKQFYYPKGNYSLEVLKFKNNKLARKESEFYYGNNFLKPKKFGFNYSYDSKGNLFKVESDKGNDASSDITEYKYDNYNVIKTIKHISTLGNGEIKTNIKNYSVNGNYLFYEFENGNTSYQKKNGVLYKSNTFNTSANKNYIYTYTFNKNGFLEKKTGENYYEKYVLNNENLIEKELNKNYTQHYKYIYDTYGNWIIAYQLAVTDKDYNGNKTKTHLYGTSFSFYIREIKYSNGDVTGSKDIEDGKTKNIIIKLRSELYDELINEKKPYTAAKINFSDLGLPKTDLIEDYGLKIGGKNIIPKQVNEKQFDQRFNRNKDITTKLERTRYKVFDVNLKKIKSYNIVYNGKTTYQTFTYNNKGNLTTFKDVGSISSLKKFNYDVNKNISFTTLFNGEINGTKQLLKKTDYGYISSGLINKKYIIKNNLVQKIITNYNRDEPSEDFLTYNNNGQLVKSTDSFYTTTYTYNSNGDIETHLEKSNNTNSFTKRSYTYKYDKYGNWIISLTYLESHFKLTTSSPYIPVPTLREITYSNGEITGTTDINTVENELIYLRKKSSKKTINKTVTWKKTSKTNFNFYLSNKETIKATNRYMGNHLLLFDVDNQQLYLFENFATAPLNKLNTAKKINVDTKNGYWFKNKNNSVSVFTSQGKYIEKSSIYKYANNNVDVIFKGENQTKQVVLKNYKNAKPLEVFPIFSYDSYTETKITTLTKPRNSKCLKGDCENGYGEEKYESGDTNEGFFENGKPNGPMHTSYKTNNTSVFTTFNDSYRNSSGFNYTYDGIKISSYTNLSKNIGFINNYTTKKTYQLNIKNGKIISKTELRYNNNSKCVVGNCTNGTGIYEYSNSTYMGTFKNGKRDGVGTIYFKNGDQYIGEFYIGNYHGLGTYIKSKYDYYLGMYKYGKYHGKGVKYYSKDNYKAGVWENGNLRNDTHKNTTYNKTTNSLKLANLTTEDKNEIQKCSENSSCVSKYFNSLYYKNKSKSDINKKMRGYFLDLHTINPKLAYNIMFKIDSDVLNAINIKSLPKEVQVDLRKRADGLMKGYQNHLKKQGY